MTPAAKTLTRAILTRSKELGVSVGKTKLLKLLYLADIEHFRDTGETCTGLNWILYLYGPWSPDYDGLLEQLEAEGAISKQAFTAAGAEGERLSVQDEIDLSKVIVPAGEYFRTKHLIDTWLERATAQLLDFVYFETEPMIAAEKLKPLDFSKISKEPPLLYRRSRGATSPREKHLLRSKFASVAKAIKERTARLEYDYGDDFAEALAAFSNERPE
jgi:hypothetical protein